MALTKISRSLLDTGVSDSSDATAITIDSSEKVGLNGLSAGDYWSTSNQLVLGNTTSAANGGMTIATANDAVGQIYFADGTSGDARYRGQIQYTHVSDAMDFATAASFRMRIDSSGNVGIGTSSPNRRLTVFKSSSPVLNIKNSDADLHLEQAGENSFIGNSSTSGYLQIFTNNGNSTSQFNSDGSFQIGAASIPNLKFSQSSDVISITAKKDGTDDIVLAFHTQASGGTTGERMRIDGGGNFFIRKTAHSFATVGVEFLNSNITNMTNYQNSVLNLHRVSTNGVILEFFKDNGSVGSISTNSNSLPSDRNFKRDISDLNLGLNLITKLKPSQYNYKLDDEDCPKMYGLIAQDLEESLIEVGVEKNSTWLLQHNPKDNEKQSDYALDYLKLTPVLIKAIQELSAKVEELESKINE